ncbi:MAG TPA: hypothetical protein VFY84_01300, partial [Jiangellales bacterium]|nr:hypothetical protein [Jiangellales bacterium]
LCGSFDVVVRNTHVVPLTRSRTVMVGTGHMTRQGRSTLLSQTGVPNATPVARTPRQPLTG